MKTIEQQIAVMQHFANGGEVERTYLNGTGWLQVKPHAFDWVCFDYRIKEVDPYAELKAAAKDPTKQIRLLDENGPGKHGTWTNAGYMWRWVFPAEDYKIRDKPRTVKPRTVKMLAWFGFGTLVWRTEEYKQGPGWKRAHSEDKTIEVEA